MTQANLTQKQEEQLAQALELTQQFEQKLQELDQFSDAFVQKYKRESIFNSFKERINLGQQNQIPIEAKLILLGEVIYAAEKQDITPNQARKLEELLGLSKYIQNYSKIREQAILGELV
ncbi:hypothetical protein [Chroococcus sp. FPU101]|uniref:hypothetical protein n=1 Tax=Chroococcus sp. FPU101 TaxID=1974212 RepID=UPI001A8FE6C9|nr:hypothetical protein [Chroococcus sp. FPU101]GFE69831.1 hypothetical protein CFPU101_24410 [Chroococcus sp. FPU101]